MRGTKVNFRSQQMNILLYMSFSIVMGYVLGNQGGQTPLKKQSSGRESIIVRQTSLDAADRFRFNG